MKNKYAEIVSRMSYVELKQFKKHEYKTMVLKEIAELLPTISKSRLDTTAQCISNFLQNNVQEQLRQKPRQSTMDSTDLSETVINDLDTSFESAENVPIPDDENTNGHITSESEPANENHTSLDDSVTLLKQAVYDKPNITQQPGADKNKQKRSAKNTKCSETCKVKPTTKRKFSQIRCSRCTRWFHETCVGITDDEPVGIWLCQTCRDVPMSIKQNISNMKKEISDLKECTKNILKAVKDLSSKVENSLECVNDRITSLSTQINAKDLCISESIENLQDTTGHIKKSLD